MSFYELIDKEKMIEITTKCFSKVILKSTSLSDDILSAEPTLATLRSMLANASYDDVLKADRLVNLTKSLQNAVGLFHQEVLGAFPGWSSTGANGGSFDIRSEKRVSLAEDNYVLAEVKMRYNTIKASDEKLVFDNLKNAYIHNGKDNHRSYLVQIVPKRQNSYDEPWKVSGRELDQRVRHIDGVSAYHMVSGSASALVDLINILPEIVDEAYVRLMGKNMLSKNIDKRIISETIETSFPLRSHFSEF